MEQAYGTLWLHVGVHKTGTTSIQQALSLRQAEIEAAGRSLHPDRNAAGLANQFLRPTLRSTFRLMGGAEPTEAGLHAALSVLRRARGKRADMIVSSEGFCLLRTPAEAERLGTELHRIFSRIIPVLSLRNLAAWQAARENQLRKNNLWDKHLALAPSQSSNGAWYYDPSAIRAFWNSLGSAVEIDYDAALARDGDILPAFADATGMPALFQGLDLRLNVRSHFGTP